MTEHTVQIARRPEEEWGALHSIYDDLLTYQVLICPTVQTTLVPHQGSYWRNVPLLPSRTDRSFLDRSCFITKCPSAMAGVTDKDTITPTSSHSQTATNSNSLSVAQANPPPKLITTPPDSKMSTNTTTSQGTEQVSASKPSKLPIPVGLCSSDEEEGGGSPKVLAPKMKATLQRRVARVKRSLAYQVVAAPSWRWDASRSVRHNQDLQRDRESRIMKDLTSWLSMARSPDSAAIKPQHNESTSRSSHSSGKHDSKKKEPPSFSPGNLKKKLSYLDRISYCTYIYIVKITMLIIFLEISHIQPLTLTKPISSNNQITGITLFAKTSHTHVNWSFPPVTLRYLLQVGSWVQAASLGRPSLRRSRSLQSKSAGHI